MNGFAYVQCQSLANSLIQSNNIVAAENRAEMLRSFLDSEEAIRDIIVPTLMSKRDDWGPATQMLVDISGRHPDLFPTIAEKLRLEALDKAFKAYICSALTEGQAAVIAYVYAAGDKGVNDRDLQVFCAAEGLIFQPDENPTSIFEAAATKLSETLPFFHAYIDDISKTRRQIPAHPDGPQKSAATNHTIVVTPIYSPF